VVTDEIVVASPDPNTAGRYTAVTVQHTRCMSAFSCAASWSEIVVVGLGLLAS
jgi:hypothetical protein